MSAPDQSESQQMQATEPDSTPAPTSSAELPYGPLPARPDRPGAAEPARPSAGTPRLRAEPADAVAAEWADDEEADAEDAEASAELEIAPERSDADDDVHFGVAAKALGVSRKTVERMVKRGQLQRGPSGSQATVSKRALVAVLEQRRRDVGQPAQAAEMQPGEASDGDWRPSWPQDATSNLHELLAPVLEPLLDEFVAARTRTALLESQLEDIKTHTARQRVRDELLVALATGGWRQRRRARRAALRHYVLGDDPSEDPG